MIPDLLSQNRVRDGFNQVIDGIYRRMDTFKTLNLLSDGLRVVPVGLDLIHRSVIHVADAQAGKPAALTE